MRSRGTAWTGYRLRARESAVGKACEIRRLTQGNPLAQFIQLQSVAEGREDDDVRLRRDDDAQPDVRPGPSHSSQAAALRIGAWTGVIVAAFVHAAVRLDTLSAPWCMCTRVFLLRKKHICENVLLHRSFYEKEACHAFV